MQFGRSDERRQAELDAAEREAYELSPVGLAETAKARGDTFLQLQLDTAGLSANSDGAGDDVLGDIERIGWRLEHTGFVWVQTGGIATRRLFSEDIEADGFVLGVYLFRNAG